MDTTAFKVSHSAGCDKNATPLLATRARSVSIGAMAELSRKVQNASAHISLCTGKEQSKSSGAMDESSGNVQKEHTHIFCDVTVDGAVIQICCPVDSEATTLQVAKAKSETPLGQCSDRVATLPPKGHLLREFLLQGHPALYHTLLFSLLKGLP